MSAHEARRPLPFFYGYAIVLCTFIIAATLEGSMFSFGVFFEPLLSEFGWTRAMTAGAVSMTSIVHIPIAFAAGRLTDRFGSRQVLTACGFFLGLGLMLMSLTSALWHLYLFYGVIVAIGLGFYWIPILSILPRWFVKRRALMMGILASGIGVGQLTFPPLVNWLISAYGWRMSFLIIGGIDIAVIMAAAQFLRQDPKKMGLLPYGESETIPENIAATKGFSLREAVGVRQFWVLSLIYFSWMFCLSVVVVHSVIHAMDIGLSPASAASTLAIIGITGIIGRISFGRLADVFGMKPVLIISFILMTIAFAWLLIAGEAWMIFLFAALFGISYGAFEILQGPIIADLFGMSSFGAITAVAHNLGIVGFILGPVVAGYIFDVNNSYLLAFTICASLAFICCISSLFLPLSKARK